MNTENDCKPGFVIKLTIAPTETNTTLKSMCGGTCGGVAVNGGILKPGPYVNADASKLLCYKCEL